MTTIGRLRLPVLVALGLCSSCTDPVSAGKPAFAAEPEVDEATVNATNTPPVEHGALASVAFWSRSDAPDETLILGAAEIAGLRLYTTAGEAAGVIDGIEAAQVSVLRLTDAGSGPSQPLVLIADAAEGSINAYHLDPDTPELHPRMANPLSIGDEITGLCHYESPLSGSAYFYAVTDRGVIHHYEAYSEGDGIAARLLRTIPSGKGSGFCAVDRRDGMLYVSEEHIGVWRLGAEPESDTAREPVDLREPFGSLSDDVKGVTVYRVDRELSYLLVGDAANRNVAVYALPDATRVATLTLEGLAEPEGISVTDPVASGAADGGVLAVADQSGADGGSNIKLVTWGATGLRRAAADAPVERPPVVRPVLDTEPVASVGDAADDPAIWVHPQDPAKSRVIGTDKQKGLYVYDLQGRVRQLLPHGKMNNVDVRDGFTLGGETVSIAVASNRSDDSIAVYRIDPADGTLTAAADGILATGFADPYGLCLYRSAQSGDVYVFVNDGDSGDFRQWRLADKGNGRVGATRVRDFAVGSQAEGCVADDESGALYIAEEDVGLWRYSAEPHGGSERTRIDATGDGGGLTDDVEGVALWLGGNGTGYLIVSNQGADNYAVYRREGDNAYVGHFHVVADSARGLDGASETDGLEVTSADLGGRFGNGLLVVQDGRNIAPEEAQNFKYVSWQDVIAALEER